MKYQDWLLSELEGTTMTLSLNEVDASAFDEPMRGFERTYFEPGLTFAMLKERIDLERFSKYA